MKIGYIIADFPVLSETFVVNDIKGLEALGHEVHEAMTKARIRRSVYWTCAAPFHTPLGRFLSKDGDNAVMTRVLNFLL